MSFWAWPKCHFLHQFLDLASVSNIQWKGSQWLCICLHRCKSCYHITACKGVASPGLQIFGCWGELKSLRAVSVGEWTSHACNFQDVWKWKSARRTTSLKAAYAPGLEYNVEWFISVISHVWLSNPPPPLNAAFFNAECHYIDLFVWDLHFLISPRLYLKWNSCIYKNFTLANTNTIFFIRCLLLV